MPTPQFFFQLSTQEAVEAIAQRVMQLQTERPEPNPKQEQEAESPISIDEACTLLRISRPTLNTWRARGLIRAHQIGRRVYLFKSELLKALEQSRKTGRGRA